MEGKQQGQMCASSTKEVQTSTNATGDVNKNAERQGQQKEDSGTTSDATMTKVDCSQEKYDGGKVTKVNIQDRDMSDIQEEQATVVQESMKSESDEPKDVKSISPMYWQADPIIEIPHIDLVFGDQQVKVNDCDPVSDTDFTSNH